LLENTDVYIGSTVCTLMATIKVAINSVIFNENYSSDFSEFIKYLYYLNIRSHVHNRRISAKAAAKYVRAAARSTCSTAGIWSACT
jgi:hypothetical protein